MQTIAGMQGTGRRLTGPGISLEEVANGKGVKHSVLLVDAAHRDHPTLHSDLEFGIGFMEQPEVTGLVRLASHSPDEGAFVYPTGTVWSVAEIVRELASVGEVCGIKAGLELCYMAGEILVEAADQSAHSGLPGHGSVDPWKLVLKPDGQVSIIGYGLPRPEIEAFLDDDTRLPGEDSLRYCAPENLADEPVTDLSSDLFALSLIALELMVGRPVYDGLVSDVKQQAQRGEAARKLYQWRDRLPTAVREVLGKALKPDPDTRFRDGLDYVYGVHDLLGGIDAGDGPSLREIVTQVRARQKRGTAVMAGKTGALTSEELAELAADLNAEGAPTRLSSPRSPRPEEDAEQEDKPRWQRATRNRSGDSPRSPRRGRRAPKAAEEASAPEVENSARDRLLRRLRNRGGEKEPEEAEVGRATELESAPKKSSGRRRRPGGRAAALLERLRSSSGETIPPVSPTHRSKPPEPVEEPAPPAEPTLLESPVEPPSAPIDPPRPQARPETKRPPTRRQRPAPVADATETDTLLANASQLAASPATVTSSLPVEYEGRTVEVDPTFSVDAAVQRAVGVLGLVTADLMGTRIASYRLLSRDGAVLRAQLGAEVQGPVTLQRVENRPIQVTFRANDATSKLVVGAALQVRELVPSVQQMFGLKDPVGLFVGGRRLEGSELLEPGADVEVRT